jgi:hypothetical protein
MKFKEPFINILFFLLFNNAIGFSQKEIKLQGFCGVRVRDNKNPSFNVTSKTIPITMFRGGARVIKNQFPVFIETSVSLFIEPMYDFAFGTSLSGKRVIYNYDIGWKYRKSVFGGGYVKSKYENPAIIAIFPFSIRNYYGAHLFYRRHSGNLSLELRSELIFKPSFAGIVPYDGNYVFDCLYHFNYTKNKENNEIIHPYFWLTAKLGSRFFWNKSNSIVLSGEATPKVGIAPAFGIDILYKKFPIGLSFEKDIWVSINGGHPVRNFKGFIANTAFGLKWNEKLSNSHYFRVGLHYIITRDLELEEVKPNSIQTIYDIHGIGLSISYELFNKTEIEFRNNFPLDGRKLFEPRLITIGLFYQLQK